MNKITKLVNELDKREFFTARDICNELSDYYVHDGESFKVRLSMFVEDNQLFVHIYINNEQYDWNDISYAYTKTEFEIELSHHKNWIEDNVAQYCGKVDVIPF